jgi:hypothetical protein
MADRNQGYRRIFALPARQCYGLLILAGGSSVLLGLFLRGRWRRRDG